MVIRKIDSARFQGEKLIPTDSATAYEAHALAFMQARDTSTIGAEVIKAWCSDLPHNARVLELACGAGYPVTRVLTEAGLQVWAVDSSSTLLSVFAERFSAVPVECAKVQECDFFGLKFDAVLAVGLMFLLNETEQIAFIHRVGKRLVPGGCFLFTAPDVACDWVDLTTGISSQSLGRASYENHFLASGLRLMRTFMDEGGNHYFDLQLLA